MPSDGCNHCLGGHAGTKPTLDYDSQESEWILYLYYYRTTLPGKIHALTCLAPCWSNFVGDAYLAMSAVEIALFVVDAASGPGHYHHQALVCCRGPVSAAHCSSTAWIAPMQTTRP